MQGALAWPPAGNQFLQPIMSTAGLQVQPGFRAHPTICMVKPEVNPSRKGIAAHHTARQPPTVHRRAVQRGRHGLGIAGVEMEVCTAAGKPAHTAACERQRVAKAQTSTRRALWCTQGLGVLEAVGDGVRRVNRFTHLAGYKRRRPVVQYRRS